jgi:hypothetical protein
VTIYAPADCGYSIPGLWPLIQHSRPLPNGQSDPPPVLNRLCEDISCLVEIVAAVQQTVDLRAVLCPLLDLVEVADIRNQRVIGFFVGPIAHQHCVYFGRGPAILKRRKVIKRKTIEQRRRLHQQAIAA